MSKLVFNNNCYFGEDCINNLSTEILKNQYKKAFVLTDNNICNTQIYKTILDEIQKSKIFSVLFSDISSEPKISEIKNAYNYFIKSNCDFILAIGGGSVIDSAKALAIIVNNPIYKDVVSLSGEKNNLNQPIDVIAIPTTSSSGAETSKSLVVTDEIRNKKIICRADNIVPKICFCETTFFQSMPDIVTLSSGFDALTHAVESLISNKSTIFTKSLANDAIKVIIKNLPICYDEPDNLQARENMAYGAYMASLAYSNSGLGICHSLAHAVANVIEIPHGIALAILLPAVLKFNMFSKASSDYKYIADAFDLNIAKMTDSEICRESIRLIENFKSDFNIPKKLSDYGMKESNLDIVALNAYDDICTSQNARECNTTDLYLILKKVL